MRILRYCAIFVLRELEMLVGDVIVENYLSISVSFTIFANVIIKKHIMKTHEEISKKIIALMSKNNIDIYTTSSLTYGSLCIYSIETDGDKILYEGCDDDYRTLTDVDALTELYDEMRLEYEDVHISELTKEQVEELTNIICWNSIFLSDYANPFGVKPLIVSNYADGFLENLADEMGWDDAMHFINTCAVGERFYNYIQSVEE